MRENKDAYISIDEKESKELSTIMFEIISLILYKSIKIRITLKTQKNIIIN